jgi:putative hydrolase of the HAD superfamily
MSPITAVLFDYGMVLSGPPDPAAWQRLKQVFQANEPAFHAAYWNHRHAYDRGTLNAITYWQAVAEDLRKPLDSGQLRELIATDTALWTQPNQPMIDWAAALQHAGIKTGILSNLGDEMELGILARFPWLHNFAHHTFSHRLLLAKPEPAIYQHAAEGLAVPSNEILFLDDREENIVAARAAGMQAILYSTHDRFLADMAASGFTALLTPPPQVPQ